MAKNQPATYPKTYATVISIAYYGYRVGQPVKRYTYEEWQERSKVNHGKRRVYHLDTEYQVRTDSGELLTLRYKDWSYGSGGRKRRKRMALGCRVKMYKHPKDSRPWRYKFLGD